MNELNYHEIINLFSSNPFVVFLVTYVVLFFAAFMFFNMIGKIMWQLKVFMKFRVKHYLKFYDEIKHDESAKKEILRSYMNGLDDVEKFAKYDNTIKQISKYIKKCVHQTLTIGQNLEMLEFGIPSNEWYGIKQFYIDLDIEQYHNLIIAKTFEEMIFKKIIKFNYNLSFDEKYFIISAEDMVEENIRSFIEQKINEATSKLSLSVAL